MSAILLSLYVSLLLLVLSRLSDGFPSPSIPTANLKGVIFDMDGTLIEPSIDFKDMRTRIYKLASQDFGYTVDEGDVVTMTCKLSPKGQAQAKEIFDDIEEQARQNMQLMPGMLNLCQGLQEHGIHMAVLTRNVLQSVEYLEEHHTHSSLSFWPKVARDSLDEDGLLIPPKPFPDAIQYICRQWDNCAPSQVIMVGDSDKDDVVAGNRAKCGATVLLKIGGEHDNDSGNDDESLASERIPTVVVESLMELQTMLGESMATID